MTESRADFRLALEKELDDLRALQARLKELSTSVPGRLSVQTEGGRRVYTHHFKDAATGAACSRRLGRNEGLLLARIKAARAAEKLLAVVDTDIRALERALKAYRAPDLQEAALALGPAYREIPLQVPFLKD